MADRRQHDRREQTLENKKITFPFVPFIFSIIIIILLVIFVTLSFVIQKTSYSKGYNDGYTQCLHDINSNFPEDNPIEIIEPIIDEIEPLNAFDE